MSADVEIPERGAGDHGRGMAAGLPREAGLYVHFPFCRRRCHYCDFNTYAVPVIPAEPYTQAILRELETRAAELTGARIVSVFFGGGTPGLWGPEPVGRVLRAAEAALGITDLDALEVTIEVNPGECDEDMLRGYRQVGVNRVSFGVQSLDDRLLAAVDRIHRAEEAREALRMAPRCGFERWSCDVMFGLPGQSLARWERDLREIVSLGPSHVSAYNLIVEEGTPLALYVRDGKVKLPPDSRQVRMLERGRELLEEAGLARYEISNFARPGQESIHNLLYWTGRPYLGLGAGAHSFVSSRTGATDGADAAAGEHGVPGAVGRRTTNVRKFGEYMAAVNRGGRALAFEEAIDPLTHVRERLMTGLRLDRGVDLDDIRAVTGIDVLDRFSGEVGALRAEGLLALDGATLRLTEQAVAISDAVFRRFF